MPAASGPAPPLSSTVARSCGECGLCCKLLAVDEIGKPAHEWCAHFSPGAGCLIYDTRPAACRTFECLWLKQAELGAEWQPKRCHLVLYLDAKGGQLVVNVDPDHPNAWRAQPFYDAIRGWADRGLEEGLQIVVKVRRRVLAVLPDRDVDLGEVADDEQIRISRVHTPEGVGLIARKVKLGGPDAGSKGR